MLCHNCGKENRADSGFCRHCGAQLKTEHSHHPRKPSLFKKISGRMWIVIGVVILISGGTAYAAPKINDYLAVNAAVSNAKQLQSKGDYKDALAALTAVEGRWTFQSKKQELEDLKKQEGVYIQDQSNFNLAISEENSGDLNDAQQVLQSIATDFPQYSQIQNEIASVQSKIESQLQSQTLQAQDQAKAAQAEKAQADAAAAQASAQAAQAAKDKADAQAAAAAAAQAQAEANAQAVAEAQAKAQADAQAAADRRASIILAISKVYSSLIAANNTFYSIGIDDSSAGSYSLAISLFNQAKAVFITNSSDAQSLSTEYTNLEPDIYNAIQNIISAANNCSNAATAAINVAEGYGDASITNTYHNSCISYASSVQSFLNTPGN